MRLKNVVVEQKPILLSRGNSQQKVKVYIGYVTQYCVIDNVIVNGVSHRSGWRRVGEISTHQKQGMESSTTDIQTKNSQSAS